MVSTYHLIKLLQNDYSLKVNRKRIQQPDREKIKCVFPRKPITPTPKPSIPTCRVCLQEGGIPIFNNDQYNIPLSYYLKLICEIDVTADDTYPQYLCKPCLDTVVAAIKLRNTAKESQVKLRRTNSNYQNINKSNTMKHNGKKSNSDTQTLSPQQEDTLLNVERHTPQQYKEIEMAEQCEKYFKKVFTKENGFSFQCQICEKVYKRTSMSDHLVTHLPDTVYKYVCETCGKTFKKYCTFYQHQVIHRDELPFKCDLCPYKGRYRDQLQGHIKRIHLREYNYQCTQCSEKFLDTNSLRRHKRRHSEPTFQCATCQKSFYDKSMLKEHIQTNHMGDAHVCKCDICGKHFKRRKHLLVHQIKIHKRKRVYNNRANYLKLEKKFASNEVQNKS